MVTGKQGKLPLRLGFSMELLFLVNRQCALTAFCVQVDAQERQDGVTFPGVCVITPISLGQGEGWEIGYTI